MSTTLDEILRSPIGRNSAYWLKWHGWKESKGYWDLHEICVMAALRFSEGIDGPDDIPAADDTDILEEARALADVIDHHPNSRALTRASSSQVHLGNLRNGIDFKERKEGHLHGKPSRVLWTSSLMEDNRSSWLAAINSSFVPIDKSSLNYYRVSVDTTKANIFNIDSLEEVIGLVELYGVPEGEKAAVDWEAVRLDFDAVHLSFRGVLAAQGVPVGSTNGAYSLAFWDCESTAWFNDEHFTGWTKVVEQG